MAKKPAAAKPEKAPKPPRQAIHVLMREDVADWLRGAAAAKQCDMVDILEAALAEHLPKIERQHGSPFPRLGPRRR